MRKDHKKANELWRYLLALGILPIALSLHYIYFLIEEGANSRPDIRQQKLKSLNISGSDVSKVMAMVMMMIKMIMFIMIFIIICFITLTMSKVDPKLLARAVVKLKEITLTYTCLTKYYFFLFCITMVHRLRNGKFHKHKYPLWSP